MSYTSKYAQKEMSRAVKDGDPKKKKKDKAKKRVQMNKAGGSGQDTKGQDKKYQKNMKRNEKVDKRRASDMKKGKTKNLSKKSRTYRI